MLVLGVGNDLNMNVNSTVLTKDSVGSKRPFKPSNDVANNEIFASPAKALISHVLPAVSKLQVQAWRAQVSEEILASTSVIWPNLDFTNGSTTQRSNSNIGGGQREKVNPPNHWQKRIKGVLS